MTQPIASESVMQRLRAERDFIMEAMTKRDPALGEAMMVTYDKEWADKNEIGRFGRMTMTAKGPAFFVGPKKINREKKYDTKESGYFDFVRSWEEGRSYQMPVDRILRGPPDLKQLQKKTKYFLRMYEFQLFAKLKQTQQVTLVNPSMRSMVNAIRVKKEYGFKDICVMVTSNYTETWAADLRNFVQGSGGALRMLTPYHVEGVAYLGTNTPLWYPSRNEWLRLVHSPHIDPSGQFDCFTVQYFDTAVVTKYKKADDYEIVSSLSRDTGAIVYNPETVDMMLTMPKGPQVFFVETSFPLFHQPQDNKVVWHAPWFLTVRGQEQVIGSRKWRIDGLEVEDVEGEGTYLSRRMRIPAPLGYSWKKLEKEGTHWCTYSSLKPHKDYNVKIEKKQGSEYVTFGKTCLITGVVKVHATYNTRFVRKDAVLPGVFRWRLNSSDVDMVQLPLPPDFFGAMDSVYMDDLGRVFSHTSMAEDAMLYYPKQTSGVLVPFLPHGEVRLLRCFKTNEGTYVDVGQYVGEKMYYVFSSTGEIESVLPSLSIRTPGFFSFRTLVENAPDPHEGSMISGKLTPVRINAIMENVEVKLGQDSKSVEQISRELGISVELVNHYMSHLPGYVIWKPGNVNIIQYVMEKNIKERLPGTIEEGYVSGLTWYEAITRMPRNTSLFLRTSFPSSFYSFLRWNRYMVQERMVGLSYVLKVKIPNR